MEKRYQYSVEPCLVCGAWAVVMTDPFGKRIALCNNLATDWHKYYKEQQALQQAWLEGRESKKTDPNQYREVLAGLPPKA